MNFDKIIGIDPGLSGGIAISWKDNLVTSKMPSYQKVLRSGKKKNQTDVVALRELLSTQAIDYNPVIFLELVQGWLSDTDSNPGKRFQIQKMLDNYSALKSTIQITGIPFVEVRPQDWQKGLNLILKGESKADRKKRYIRFAQNFYSKKATAWNGDAICLVQFGIKKLKLDPEWVYSRLNIRTIDKLI